MSTTLSAPKPGIFYGWIIVAACFALTATLGETLVSFGVFFNPLETEFGWNRSMVSSGFTAMTIGYAISVAIGGRLCDKYNPRLILLISAGLSGLGMCLCSQVQNVTQLCIFLLIAGLGSGATFSVPTATVQRWFLNKRSSGLALGIVVSGIGFGQLVFTQLINYFILNFGWRNAYLIIGIVFFIVISISALILKPSPIELEGILGNKNNTPRSVNSNGWSAAKAIITSAYTGIIYAVCAVMIAIQTVVVHLMPHAIDLGMSSTAAAAALGLLGGLTIPGRLTSGLLALKIGWKRTFGMSIFGMALSMAWLFFLRESWMLYVFVFFGLFWGIRMVAQLGILGEFFGLKSVGALIGITSGISNLVGAAAPFIAGFLYDTTGSYLTAFAIIAALLLSGGIVITMLKKPLMQS